MATWGEASLQAAMTSVSRMEPPGWAMAVTPWASDAQVHPVAEGEEPVRNQYRTGQAAACGFLGLGESIWARSLGWSSGSLGGFFW